jgi:hypothetical protein
VWAAARARRAEQEARRSGTGACRVNALQPQRTDDGCEDPDTERGMIDRRSDDDACAHVGGGHKDAATAMDRQG